MGEMETVRWKKAEEKRLSQGREHEGRFRRWGKGRANPKDKNLKSHMNSVLNYTNLKTKGVITVLAGHCEVRGGGGQ